MSWGPKWDWDLIEPNIKLSIDEYFNEHKPVGGFLRSVIANDLTGAVQRADTLNIRAIPAISTYVHINPAWYGKGLAVGSYERYENWIAEWSEPVTNEQMANWARSMMGGDTSHMVDE